MGIQTSQASKVRYHTLFTWRKELKYEFLKHQFQSKNVQKKWE